jgi:hypothetical protein
VRIDSSGLRECKRPHLRCRRTAAGEHPASEDAQARALTEREFAEAEAYEAKRREEDKEKYHEKRLP